MKKEQLVKKQVKDFADANAVALNVENSYINNVQQTDPWVAGLDTHLV